MGRFQVDQSTRLSVVIGISLCFFIAEITGMFPLRCRAKVPWTRLPGRAHLTNLAAGFMTHSLALVADAFHYVSLHRTHLALCNG